MEHAYPTRTRARLPLAFSLATPLAFVVLGAFGGSSLIGCSSDGGVIATGEDGEGPNGDGTAGGGSKLGNGPVQADGGQVQDDRCFGIACTGGLVCSRGNCVPDSTDNDGDGVTVVNDCDDDDPTVYPGAIEVCNGKDDNCDGRVDEGFDKDGDGYFTCERDGKVADCNDNDPSVNDPSKPGRPAANDRFSPLNPKWRFVGGASTTNFASSGSWTRLTLNEPNRAGAVYWNGEYEFDRFELSATVSTKFPSSGSEGIAFVWVPGMDLAKVGTVKGYGFVGLGGYAVVLDTLSEAGEPEGPYVALIDETGTRFASAKTTVDLRDGQDHTLRITFNNGAVTVRLDATRPLANVAIPFYAKFKGHWGFTAASGAASQGHYVTNVSMTFPNGQSCVP